MNKKEEIIELQIIHKVAIEALNLPKRWVIWATTQKYKKSKYFNPENRVWLCIIADDSDNLPLRQRSLLVKNFFEPIIGSKIEFSLGSSCVYSHESHYSVHEHTLPALYQQVSSFTDICNWFQENRPECIENDLKLLREERNREIAATKKKNKAIKERELEEQRKNALKLAFVKGRNPKHGNEQWEARHNDHLYILRREDEYEPSEGKIPVEEIFDLVSDRITLVQRI